MMKHQSVPFYKIICYVLIISFTGIQCSKKENPTIVPIDPPASNTFSNPLMKGADPWVYQKDGTYYYLQTTGNSIRIWKTQSISKLASANSVAVFTPASGAPNSRNIWAPELHFLDGKWYIYYTAGDGSDKSQRTWVLENSSADPTVGNWTDKGKIFSMEADFWAIDGTVMTYNSERYFVWCGRPDVTNVNLTQNIYISKMSNPWTLVGPATMLTSPEYVWERNGFGVNEAPQALKNANNKNYLIYSASFCGTDDYALGLLALKEAGNPLNRTDWVKNTQPVFVKSPQNKAYGPGHNSFFKSPDGKEDWIIYHANSNSGEGCADQRNIRIQKFTFTSTGLPNFGEPTATGLKVERPSGEQ